MINKTIKNYIRTKNQQLNSLPTKSDSPKTETPLLKIPYYSEEAFYIYYNKNNNSLKCSIHYLNEKINNIDFSHFPVEECSKCHSNLIIENSYYNSEASKIKYFCNLCIKEEKDIVKLIPDQEFKSDEYNIIKKIKEYKNKNEKSVTSEYIVQINELIEFLNKLSYLGDVSSKNTNFNNQYKVIKNFFDNLSFYYDEIIEIEMNDIYLFLSNILLVGIAIYEKSWFIKSFINFYNENISFNISKIRIDSLKNLIKLIFNKVIITKKDYKTLYDNNVDSSDCFEFLDENISDTKNLYREFDFDKCYFISSIIDLHYSSFESKLEILKMNIKLLENEINQIISNYYYSFDSISTKKVMERKIINTFLYLIFKNYSSYFKQINEDEKILNAVIKELKGINKYFGNRQDAKTLVQKINKEINHYENKKNLIIEV